MTKIKVGQSLWMVCYGEAEDGDPLYVTLYEYIVRTVRRKAYEPKEIPPHAYAYPEWATKMTKKGRVFNAKLAGESICEWWTHFPPDRIHELYTTKLAAYKSSLKSLRADQRDECFKIDDASFKRLQSIIKTGISKNSKKPKKD